MTILTFSTLGTLVYLFCNFQRRDFAEKEIMKQLTRGEDNFLVSFRSTAFNEKNTVFKQSPPEIGWQVFNYKRKDIMSKDLVLMDLSLMPGFRLSWEVTGVNVSNVTPLKCDKNHNDVYDLFVR